MGYIGCHYWGYEGLSQKFRGRKRRDERKKLHQIRAKLEQHDFDKRDLSKNIKVWHLGNSDIRTDYIIVELFFNSMISPKKIVEILSERLGDLF